MSVVLLNIVGSASGDVEILVTPRDVETPQEAIVISDEAGVSDAETERAEHSVVDEVEIAIDEAEDEGEDNSGEVESEYFEQVSLENDSDQEVKVERPAAKTNQRGSSLAQVQNKKRGMLLVLSSQAM